jgi:RNA polymerase sigma-70 factor (ECF subfamily)
MSMPPMPLEYLGRDAVASFFGLLLRSGREYSLVPTRANGQPAFGSYVRAPDGIRRATGLFVLELAGGQVSTMTRFESSVLPWFGLPRCLPGDVQGVG